MRALVKTRDTVELQDKPIPELPDTTSILLKVSLAALCRTDLYVAQNKIPVAEGLVLGHEFTGLIVKTGSDVEKFQIDQRVGIMPFFSNNPDYPMLGVHLNGAYAEYVTVPVTQIYPIPDTLSNEEAAFLEPIAASLAVCKLPIDPNHRGLIYGKNRIAELTHRILKIKGFTLIDEHADEQMTDRANLYDFIIETTPTEQAFEQMVRLVKPKGLIILKSRSFNPVPLPINTLVKKEIKLMGAHYGSFQEGIDLLASGKLQVDDLLGRTYSLEEAVDILTGKRIVSESNKIFFKP